MSPKRATALRINVDLLEAMEKVRDEEGLPVTTQIEIAVRAWLVDRGSLAKADRKRVGARKRP